MSEAKRVEVLVLGSGFGGKLLAWHLAKSGRKTAVAERRWIGGSCPNIACLPSKNEVWSAKIAHQARHAAPIWHGDRQWPRDWIRYLRTCRLDLHNEAYEVERWVSFDWK
jgi:pyruvate/2-oxoglutarate dehydrogenase complex dihydrolipoamide dehydrogenase (E3) component